MDRLSSCYFCGAALDASLSEYPVVPKSLQPDAGDQQTVVLCQTCRRKLATVIETVVTATEEQRRETRQARDQSADQSSMMDESGMDPQPDPDEIADANETVEDDDGGLLSGGDQSEKSADDGGLLGGNESSTTDSDSSTSQSSGRSSTDDQQRRSLSDDTAATESDDESSDASGGTSDDGPSLTRLEYNKVMRLLQNRDLPVDRAEIREVALNAYDIDASQFEAVIDAAVDKDLIAEENGQFVAPE
jgi:hypothetical protein